MNYTALQDWPAYGLYPSLSPSSGRYSEVKPIQLGPVERANLDHRSTGPN
jgi:hypothetical protein